MFYKIALLLFTVSLTACSSLQGESIYPEEIGPNKYGEPGQKKETLFSGLSLSFGGESNQNSGLNINSFLWRASLDTISFMPIASVDPFGGVILTDWYYPPENKNERFKLNVFILSAFLQADALKVSVFKEVKNDKGNWSEEATDPDVASEIEKSILTRARELKIAQ